MKYTLSLLLICALVSCKMESDLDPSETKTIDLTGTWLFQKSTDRYMTSRHRIIILEDSSYYTFSTSNGGGLIATGVLSKNDSLIDVQNLKYGIKKIDSNKIEIENHYSFYGDFTNTYKKSHYQDYKDELRISLRKDSLRNKVLGWWKLTDAKLPIKLVNYSGTYNTFVMQIKNDGRAHFYLENYLDSIVDYGYRMREDGIDFRRGDVNGSGTQLFFESDTILKMLMTNRSMDTLRLKKISKID